MTPSVAIRIVRVVATLGVAVLAGVILWASVSGDFGAEGATILDLPWGVVSLVDIYTGALVVWLWITWRDGLLTGLVFLVLLVVLGNLASAGYVAWRAWTSPDVAHLLLGRRLAAPAAGD